MHILLFGIGNVGKTVTGGLLAERLGFRFYDIDDEIEGYTGMSLENFADTVWLNERCKVKGEILGSLVDMKINSVIAVSPIYYSVNFNKYLLRPDVLAIELIDDAENIFNRLVFTDSEGNIYEDSVEYREKHRKYYISEIKKDITAFKRAHSKIHNKFHMNDDPPEEVVERIIRKYLRDDIICGRD